MNGVAGFRERLANAGYVAEPGLASALELLEVLGRPMLIEGDAGVGKTDEEIREALTYCVTGDGGARGIRLFNIESEAEFENIAAIARSLGTTCRATLRVNPDVDPTQPVILNLNVENNVPQMLRSLQATRSIEDVLERRLSK